MTDKQNFEKDINVPSKEKLSDYACDAKDCEQYSDHICCLCRNREWYRLYKDYKRKVQKLEKIKEYVESEEWGILDHIYKGILQIIEDK